MVQFSFISGIIVTLLVGVITSNIFRLEAKKKQQEVEKVAEELRCQVEETETQRKIATFEADRAQQELRDRIINTALALIEVKHYRVAQKYLSKAFQSRPENEALNRAIEICRQKIDSP